MKRKSKPEFQIITSVIYPRSGGFFEIERERSNAKDIVVIIRLFLPANQRGELREDLCTGYIFNQMPLCKNWGIRSHDRPWWRMSAHAMSAKSMQKLVVYAYRWADLQFSMLEDDLANSMSTCAAT